MWGAWPFAKGLNFALSILLIISGHNLFVCMSAVMSALLQFSCLWSGFSKGCAEMG